MKNPSIKIYENKIKNRTKFKIKTEYHRELLTPKTMKLLRRTKTKITKDTKDTYIVLLLNTIIGKNQESYTHSILINYLVNY